MYVQIRGLYALPLLATAARPWLYLLLLTLFLGGCNNPPAGDQTLTVFAAASLTEAFTELATTFEGEETGVTVQLNFAGSQQLAQQVVQGAPADIFASADERQMAVAVAAGRVTEGAPQPFASNRMVIVVPQGNPAAIGGLADLSRPGVKVVLAGETVPAGAYARQILERAAADPAFPASFSEETLANVVSNEQNVRAVLTKIALGEADAGMVYTSDVHGATVSVIAIADRLNVHATYFLAPLADSAHPDLARAFVDFTLSARGQESLARHGLQPVAKQ